MQEGKLNKKRKRKWRSIVATILFLSLAASVVYAFVRLLLAPDCCPDGESVKCKSDYLLMLTQCLLGLVVMSLPSLFAKRWKLDIPNPIYILYYLFLYCAVFLGEVFDFYYHVPHWDTMLHFFSGAMLGALGFILVTLLNDTERIDVKLNPFFVCLFAFCFALAAGAVWEIYEYTMDGLLKLNMQKYATEAGVALIGRDALADTMKDVIFDALAALLVSVAGFFTLRRKKQTAEEQAEDDAPDAESEKA